MKNIPRIPEPSEDLLKRALKVRKAATDLALHSNEKRCKALMCMADALQACSQKIVDANLSDLEQAKSDGLNQALFSRLKLNESKLDQSIDGVRKVALLPDPIGLRQLHRELDKGLVLERSTVPLGVLGVIFEARPDAVMQIASLAIRSGNAAILKGGSEASMTNKAIMDALQEGLAISDVASNSLCLLTSREESLALLNLDGLVDLIIPRGSNELVRFIQDNTRIPVLGHADGICHLYIDDSADLEKAVRIAIDSKTQYPAACNAIETVLLHQSIASSFLKIAIPIFENEGVTLRGDEISQTFGVRYHAAESDWSAEYLDLILSVKVVPSLQSALDHIHHYGSRHTDCIVTEDNDNAERFLRSVDSSGVYHNCSTRFADGFRYGFGAEVGISTQTMPPRGPVGLEGLVTYRYFLRGDGHISADYASGVRQFNHYDLPL